LMLPSITVMSGKNHKFRRGQKKVDVKSHHPKFLVI
jgi:hypothetical protein